MCEISCKNSERLLRKWQKTLGDTFFCRTLYIHRRSQWVSYGSEDPNPMINNLTAMEIHRIVVAYNMPKLLRRCITL